MHYETTWRRLAQLMLAAALCGVGAAQQASSAVAAPAQGTELDRIVAIVNGAVILDSDVDEERRIGNLDNAPAGDAALPPNPPTSWNDDIERLINRELILQQMRLQPEDAISQEQLDKEIESLKRSIPACKTFHCTDPGGWKRYLASVGLTESEFEHYWLVKMQVLAFTERRFRMGIRISQDQISTYYQKTLLPQYKAANVTAPPLSVLSARIERLLLEQQVTGLLNDWLQSLRAQGTVVILHPGESTP